jgi:two-component system alkaline phosphatase synthesis response regulator PhoP
MSSASPVHERQARVVVASADPGWREEVCGALSDPGLEVVEAKSGAEALEAATCADAPLGAIVVDAFLPDVTGLGLCRSVRESPGLGSIPLVMVSGFASEIDRVLAFENGVDDFVACPFYDRELASRLRAVMRRDARRGPAERSGGRSQFGALKVDLRRASVEVNGRLVRLTLREFDVLRRLIEHEGRVLERGELMGDPTGHDAASQRVVDTHVKSIRRKLGEARHCIETVRGVGYRFSSDPIRER